MHFLRQRLEYEVQPFTFCPLGGGMIDLKGSYVPCFVQAEGTTVEAGAEQDQLPSTSLN